jgi:hypothetical protein
MSHSTLQSLVPQLRSAVDANDVARAKTLTRDAKVRCSPLDPELRKADRLEKLAMLPLGLLSPVPSGSQADMQAARDLLELSALVAMRQGDVDGFERSLAQLQPFSCVTLERK